MAMKRLTLIKTRSDEAMKRLTTLKNWSNEGFNASLPRFIASSLSTLYIYVHAEIVLKLGKTLGNTYVKAKTTMFFSFATASTKITNFLGNCQWNSSLHRFYALIFFLVKALRQWWQILEAMKRWNVDYGKKLKQWSDEGFNAGIEIEAMKRLTLHRIASSHRFIASSLHRFCCPALLKSIVRKQLQRIWNFFILKADEKLRLTMNPAIVVENFKWP
jgi:hypothetical protein